MEVVLGAVLVGLVLIVLVGGARAWRVRAEEQPASMPATLVDDRAVVTVDVVVTDPGAPAAVRLIDDAARQAFSAFPRADEVEVRDRTGTVLSRRRRETPREIEIPPDLYDPHVASRRTPEPRDEGGAAQLPTVSRDVDVNVAGRPLIERFELPEDVEAAVGDPNDAVEIVRALLEAAGHDLVVDGEVLVSGDEAVVVIRAPIGEPVAKDALNHAYRRFRESRARRGVVVSPGYMDPIDVRRRELFDPSLAHAGPDGLQRMADAVALGADPLRFVSAPPLAS